MKTAWTVAFALSLTGCGGRVDDAASGRDPRGGDAGGSATGAGGHSSSGAQSSSGASGGSSQSGGSTGAGGRGDPAAGGSGGRPGATGGVPSQGGSGGETASGGAAASGGAGGSASGGSVTEVWVGKVQSAITFGDQQTGVNVAQAAVLVLRTSADGTSAGSVLFGDRKPPPAPTDPDAFYPSLDDYRYWNSMQLAPFNGFAYTLLDLTVQDGRVTAQFAPGELWGTWCALQPKSYPVVSGFGASSDTCAPGDAPVTTQFPSATPVKGDLCLTASVCLCADDACRPNLDRFRWSLDIQLRDGLYEGEVYSDANVGGGAWLPGIRLRRVKD